MINQGTLLGRVGKIDTKTTSAGAKITSMSIVTSKKFVKNNEKHEKVTWHNVTAFQKLAEISEKYVNVGDLIYVQGEIDDQKYTDANGMERTKHFIVAHTIKLMPKTREQPSAPAKPVAVAAEFMDDDLPPW